MYCGRMRVNIAGARDESNSSRFVAADALWTRGRMSGENFLSLIDTLLPSSDSNSPLGNSCCVADHRAPADRRVPMPRTGWRCPALGGRQTTRQRYRRLGVAVARNGRWLKVNHLALASMPQSRIWDLGSTT